MKIRIFRLSFIFLFFNFLKSDIIENKNCKDIFSFKEKELSSKDEVNRELNEMVFNIINRNNAIPDHEKKLVALYLINRLKNMVFSILNTSGSVRLNKSGYFISGFSFEKVKNNGQKSVVQFLIEKGFPVIRCYENVVKRKVYDNTNRVYNYLDFDYINKDLMNPILNAFKDAGLDFSKIINVYPNLRVNLPVVFKKSDGLFGYEETCKNIKNTNMEVSTGRGVSKDLIEKNLSFYTKIRIL